MENEEFTSEAGLIYEVNLIVSNDIVDEYLSWLKIHINEMSAFEGFLGSRLWISERLAGSPGQEITLPEDKTEVLVHYLLKNRAALESYFQNHAPKMREEGIKKFPTGFSASRRILNPTQ